MSSSNSKDESFDLGRLTLAGWILSLTSLGIFLVTIFGLLSIADRSGGKQGFSDEEIMIMSGICFGVAAAGFIAGKLLLEYLGFTVIKAKNRTRANLETVEQDITEIKLSKYSFQGNFYEVMAQFNNQQWISLLPISTNQAEYRKIVLAIVDFLE